MKAHNQRIAMMFAAYDDHGNIIDSIWAHTEQEAIRRLRARHPDVIIARIR